MVQKKSIPMGIIIISILYFLTAIQLLFYSILSFSKTSVVVPRIFIVFGSASLIAFGIYLLFLAAAVFLIGFYLLKSKRWARISAMIWSGLVIITAIFSFSLDYSGNSFFLGITFFDFIRILVMLAIILYLSFDKKIKRIFK